MTTTLAARGTGVPALADLLAAVEWPDPLLGAGTVGAWPAGNLDRLVRWGLLVEAGPAEAVACDACGFDHVESVRWVGDPGEGRHAFITCPSVGAIPIGPES